MLTRRNMLTGLVLLTLTAPAIAQPSVLISAANANKEALTGKIKLVDVRTPQEWKQTGIPAPGYPISIHERGFLKKLNKLLGDDKSAPVAFICATGERSAFVVRELTKLGYTNVLTVGEGMMGSARGKGWIASGLPVKKP